MVHPETRPRRTALDPDTPMHLLARCSAGLGALALLVSFSAAAAGQSSLCSRAPEPLRPSRDLYCLVLTPSPSIDGVSGEVELGHPVDPFTVAVTVDGRIRYAPTLTLEGLPAASSLGPYTTYVAWVATPVMYPVVRLGVVTNGRTRLPEIAFDKFVILVTAQASVRDSEPSGRIVVRGESPSTRLQPPDLMRLAIGSAAPAGSDMAEHRHGDGDHRSHSVQWTSVPMPRGLTMLPAEMALVPNTAPYLPRAGPATPMARPNRLVRLRNGDTLRLTAGLVRRTIAGHAVTMYGFDGQYPGPLISVPESSTIVVQLVNSLDEPTTIHWHGVRLENRYDGVPGLTQAAVPPGGRYTYHVHFPDAGIYWYHPHVREDVQQALGLYGNILVRSRRRDHFSPANREETLIIDDLLMEDDGTLVPFGKSQATHAFMGRFGNVFLVNGEPAWRARARRGEVVRFFLTNVSSTRTYNLSFGGARMKLVGSDGGNFEHEQWVESVVIAPAERYIVAVRFDHPGDIAFVNRVQGLDHLFGRFFYETDTLGIVHVDAAASVPDLGASFDVLRTDSAAVRDIDRYRRDFDRPVDKSLVLSLESRGLPFVTRQIMLLDSAYFTPVEWTGSMPTMNWASTTDQITWVMRDPSTGKTNMDIDWRFRRGEVIKLRLVNERRSMHAMQHPIHLHGERFLVLAVNGVPNDDLAWKDTVLVPAGATVDLLVDLANPGRWMLHCHIAEHLAGGMMTTVTVE